MSRARYYQQVYKLGSDLETLKIAPNAAVTVYEAGTTTPIIATMYAGPTGGTTKTNPFNADAYGNIEFWLDVAQRVRIVTVALLTGTITIDYEPVMPDPGAFVLQSGSGSHLDIAHTSVGSTIKSITDPASGNGVLTLQPNAGSKVSIAQPDWNETVQDFALEVVRSVQTGDNGMGNPTIAGAANATFNQIFRDDSTLGADPTTIKVSMYIARGTSDPDSTARAIEVEFIAYAPTSVTTSGARYGAVPTPVSFGSNRAIDVAMAFDPDVIGSPVNIYDAAALNVFNVAAAGADGRLFGSLHPAGPGDQGTAGVVVWGAGGYRFPFAANDTDANGQSFLTLTYRAFHVDLTGAEGSNMLYLKGRNTIGTGIRMEARVTNGRAVDIFVPAPLAGQPYEGRMGIFDPAQSLYAFVAGGHHDDRSKMQALIAAGTATYPALSGMFDTHTGVNVGTSTVDFVTASTLQARFRSDGHMHWLNGQTLGNGGGALPTFGSIGGVGPASAAQAGWKREYDATGAFYSPIWR